MTNALSSDNRSAPIACVGEVLIDLIGPLVDEWDRIPHFVPRIGGAPANMAVAIARHGGRAKFVGCIADDRPGRWIRTRLEQESVDLVGVRIAPAAQTRLAIVTGTEEHRGFDFYGTPPADTLLTASDIDAADISTGAAVLVGSLPLTAEPSRSAINHLTECCRTHGLPLLFDPNPRASTWPDPKLALEAMTPLFSAARLVKLSTADLDVLQIDPEGIRRLQADDSVLVVTDGARGSWYWYGGARGEVVASLTVNAVDPTGAGDVFMATIARRYVETGGRINEDDLRLANIAGALTTTHEGGMDAIPEKASILRYYTGTGDTG